MQAYFSFNLLRWRQPFPVTGLPVLNSVTDSSRHTLLLPALHSQWSHQVYIIHRSITSFLVVQNLYVRMRMSIGYVKPLVFIIIIFFIFGVTFVHANLYMYILASTCEDGGNPFPVIRLPVVNSVTDSSRTGCDYLRYIANGHVKYI